MEYSDVENDSDGYANEDLLEPEDLFNDEADESDNDKKNDLGEDGEKTGKSGDSKENVKKKTNQPKVVRNSRVVLNVDTLSGSNGISALIKKFGNFKFKGHGHEKEDLTNIMRILQQWICYQLCPSYDFESCMLQLEALGKKKAVQTIMKKYRLGINDWGEAKSEQEDNASTDKNEEISENNSKNEFDLLLMEEMDNVLSDDSLNEFETSKIQNESSQSMQNAPEVTLTPEQLERIAKNRKEAEERRLKRMSAQSSAGNLNEQSKRPRNEETLVAEIDLEE